MPTDTDQTPEERVTALERSADRVNGFLLDAIGATDRNEYQDGLTRTAVAAQALLAIATVESVRALHRTADALVDAAQREQVTHVTVNEVPAAAPQPPVSTSTDELDTETRAAVARAQEPWGDGIAAVPAVDREAPADAPSVPSDVPPEAVDGAAAYPAGLLTVPLDQHPEAVAAREAAELRLAAEHEHEVQEEIAKSTPSPGATPDVPKSTAAARKKRLQP